MSNSLIRHCLRKRGLCVEPDVGEKRLEDLSDQDLMRLAARGDSEAFDEIYLRYKPKLARFIRGFIQDEAAIEDLLQETFLRVYSNTDTYQPTFSFSSWIYKIATNLCLNELRRRRTHPLISLNRKVEMAFTDSESETIELHELIPDSSFVGPSEFVESSETMEEIASAVGSLSAVHREVISLRLWDELPYQQIAELMQCSVGTVKSRAFYGLRALRGKLESDNASNSQEEGQPND